MHMTRDLEAALYHVSCRELNWKKPHRDLVSLPGPAPGIQGLGLLRSHTTSRLGAGKLAHDASFKPKPRKAGTTSEIIPRPCPMFLESTAGLQVAVQIAARECSG